MSIKRFRPKRIPVYDVGDIGPGGGVIFMTPTSIGNNTGQYFEFATSISGLTDDGLPLINNLSNISSLNLGTSIGSGKNNTILLNQTFFGDFGSCLYYVNNFKNNSHNDWYIPSRDELGMALNAMTALYGNIFYIFNLYSGLLYTRQFYIFVTSSRFGSSQDNIHAYAVMTLGSDFFEIDKNDGGNLVLPIRSFYPYGV